MAKIDRIIREAAAKLAAVEERQTWALSPKEQAKLAACGTVVVAKGTRLKSSPRAERGMEQVWSGAEARYRADLQVAQEAKAREAHDAAAARHAKKSERGWF